jgi:hypothetical protein
MPKRRASSPLFPISSLEFLRDSSLELRHFSSLSALTALVAFGCIEGVKWLALFMLLALECSCTTVANRRDLYSPQPAPDLDWHRQAATTTTIRTEEALPVPANR